MSAAQTAREEILARIRAALPAERDATPPTAPRSYQRTGSLDREQCLHLLRDRLLDYGAEVIEVDGEAALSGAISAALIKVGERRFIVASEFPAAWLPSDFDVVIDRNLPIAAIEGIPAVITTSEAAVASSGTLLLVHQGAQGRRVLTLLPDHHICIVDTARVFELLPEALAALDAVKSKPLTTIAGPSATSDIEMTRILGVHGPRRLTIILYGD